MNLFTLPTSHIRRFKFIKLRSSKFDPYLILIGDLTPYILGVFKNIVKQC